MSRSRKKPYYKDNCLSTHEYWSVIRHEWKQKLNEEFKMNTPFGLYWETFDTDDKFELRNPKEIINDYDYCDYSFYVYSRGIVDESLKHWTGWSKEDVERYSRK